MQDIFDFPLLIVLYVFQLSFRGVFISSRPTLSFPFSLFFVVMIFFFFFVVVVSHDDDDDDDDERYHERQTH